MPYMLPRRQTFQEDVLPGLTKDLLLMALTQGASIPFQGMGKVATAGQYTAPGGQSTFIGPAERVASNPRMSAGQLISQQAPPQASFTPTQFGRGHVPDYESLINQSKVANLPLERQKLQGEVANQGALTGYYNSLSGGGQGGINLQAIEDAALAGDEEAVIALRFLKRQQQGGR